MFSQKDIKYNYIVKKTKRYWRCYIKQCGTSIGWNNCNNGEINMDKKLFKLRDFELSDINSIAQNGNNEKIAKNLRDTYPFPYTIEDAKSYIQICINNNSYQQCVKAIVVEGEAVGSIGVFMQRDVYCKSAELGYWLGEEYWGKGIMTEAIKEICNIAFRNYDIVRIYAEPYATNKGSRRVLEKAGFELEGIFKKSVFKNGEIIDSHMYALVK